MIYNVKIFSWKTTVFEKQVQFETDEEANAYTLGVFAGIENQGVDVTGLSCAPAFITFNGVEYEVLDKFTDGGFCISKDLKQLHRLDGALGRENWIPVKEVEK